MAAAARSEFAASERPAMPGGPYTPSHPTSRKIGYVVTGLTIALLSTFANALVSDNLAAVAGEYGLYSAEASWLLVGYTGMSASASLFVIKGRQQFGIARIMTVLLVCYALAALLEIVFPSFATALLARCTNGTVTSTGVAMGVYYVLEALPPAKRPASIPIILGCAQISAPLARLVPVDLITSNGNHAVGLIDLAIPLIELTLIIAWPLPPTPTSKVFEPLDALMLGLLLPGLVLLVAVLTLGRIHWWSDTPWIGWLLVFAVPLLALGAIVEFSRTRPALYVGWMSQADILRFAAVAFFERIAVAEQGYGAVGLLSAAGLDNDQFHGLFVVVILAMIAGIGVVVVTLGQKMIAIQIIGAMLLIGAAGWIDSFSNGLTRGRDLVFTQAMIGFGTTLFVGPALLYGILRVMQSGPRYLLSLVMVFSFTQNVGSLTGSALLSSYQYEQARMHARVIDDSLSADRPEVAGRIAALAPSHSATSTLGANALASSAAGQANILGFLDTFRLVTVISLVGAIVVAGAALRAAITRRSKERHAG